MSSTQKIPRERLTEYFDAFSKRFLADSGSDSADVQVLDSGMGDQYIAEGVRLLGVTYDNKENALEIQLEPGDHRVYEPAEVWTVEEDDGFVSAIEIIRADSGKEIISVKRV